MVIAKAVLCGAPGVGKTQLFNLLGCSSGFQSSYVPSRSPDFTSFNFKVTENEDCLIQLWDIPGNITQLAENVEMQYLSLCTLRDAHVIVLVCDLTNASSINYFTNIYELIRVLHSTKLKSIYNTEVRQAQEQFSPQFANPKLYSRDHMATSIQPALKKKSDQGTSLPEFIILVNKVEANQRHQQQILPTHQRTFASEKNISLFNEVSCALFRNVDSVRQQIGLTASVSVYSKYKQHAGYLTQKELQHEIRENFKQVLKKHDLVVEKRKDEILAARARQREEEEKERQRLEQQRQPFPPEMEYLRLRMLKQVWGRDLLVDWCYRYMGSAYEREVHGEVSLDRVREDHPDEAAWLAKYEEEQVGLQDWLIHEPEYLRSDKKGFDWRTLGLLRRSLTFKEDEDVENIVKLCDLVSLVEEHKTGECVHPKEEISSIFVDKETIPQFNVPMSYTSVGEIDSSTATLNVTNCNVTLPMFALLLYRLGTPGHYNGKAPVQLFLFLQRQSADLNKQQDQYSVNGELDESYAPADMSGIPLPVLSAELVEKQAKGIKLPTKPRPLDAILPLHFVQMQHKDVRNHQSMHLTLQRNTVRLCLKDLTAVPVVITPSNTDRNNIISAFDSQRIEDEELAYQDQMEEIAITSPRKQSSNSTNVSSTVNLNRNNAQTGSQFKPAHPDHAHVSETLYLERLRQITSEMDVDSTMSIPFPIVVLLLHNILYGDISKQLELAWVTICQSVASQQTTTLKSIQDMGMESVTHSQAARMLYQVSANPSQTLKAVYQQSQRGALAGSKLFAEHLHRRFLFTLTRDDVITGITNAQHLLQPWLLHPLHLKHTEKEQHTKQLIKNVRNDKLQKNAVHIASDIMKYKPLISKHLREGAKK